MEAKLDNRINPTRHLSYDLLILEMGRHCDFFTPSSYNFMQKYRCMKWRPSSIRLGLIPPGPFAFWPLNYKIIKNRTPCWFPCVV